MACCEWLPRQFQELASRPHAVKDECLFRNCRHRLPFPHPPSAKTRQGLSRLCVNLEQQLRGARANLYNRLNCDANPWFLLGLQYLGSNPVDSERNPRRLFYVAANWKLMQFIIACCHRKVYLARPQTSIAWSHVSIASQSQDRRCRRALFCWSFGPTCQGWMTDAHGFPTYELSQHI